MLLTARVWIKGLARWESSSMKIFGYMELVMGLMLTVPLMMSVYFGESPYPFLIPMPFLFIFGTLQCVFFKRSPRKSPATGILMIFMAWLIAFLVSSLPYYLSGFTLVDAIFEGVSTFTTTGSTVIYDFYSLSNGLQFWRFFVQWAGGISVVMIFLLLMPSLGFGGRALINNELSDSGSYNYSMRMRSAAKNFITLYMVLTLVEVVLLIATGLDAASSVSLAFSTVSAGGTIFQGNSLLSFGMDVQLIVLVFMFMAGTNFYLHVRALYGRDPKVYAKSQEFIWTIMIFMLATVVISLMVLNAHWVEDGITASNVGTSIWEVAFTVVSMGTTTGFYISDFNAWPQTAFIILCMLSLFGAMSGSTSGGVKVYRVMILFSYIKNGMYKMLHPKAVNDVKINGHSLDRDVITSAVVVIFLFMAVAMLSTITLSILEPDMSLTDSLGASISALCNVGTGFGESGAFNNFYYFSDATKTFLAMVMWVGRMEVIMFLMLFTRIFWKDVINDARPDTNIRSLIGFWLKRQ